MIIKIKDLKEKELTPLAATYDAQTLDLEFEDLHYRKKISLAGSAELTEQSLHFYGSLESEVEQLCNRCLKPVASDVQEPFDLTYEIRDKKMIDSTMDIREVLILTHPDQFLCTADCRGICLYCGANLNHESCRCKVKGSKKGTPQTWTPLKKLFERINE